VFVARAAPPKSTGDGWIDRKSAESSTGVVDDLAARR
jgi:hypothetical protein